MGRADQDLKKASEHVNYEFDMFLATASFLTTGAGAKDRVTQNAYLESFVLHLRNLRDFYFQDQKKGRICAADYVSNVDKWKASRQDESPFLKHERRKANEFVAHLTYERDAPNKERQWDWAALQKELTRLRDCFVNQLPEHRKGWFPGKCLEGPAGPTAASTTAVTKGWTGPPGPPDREKAKTSE